MSWVREKIGKDGQAAGSIASAFRNRQFLAKFRPGPAFCCRGIVPVSKVPGLPSLSLSRLNVVIHAVADHEDIGSVDAAVQESGGEQAEHVGIGFAESMGKRPEAKFGGEQIGAEFVGGERVGEFMKGVELGVGGDAQHDAAIMQSANRCGGVRGQSHRVLKPGDLEQEVIQCRGRKTTGLRERLLDNGRPVDFRKWDARRSRDCLFFADADFCVGEEILERNSGGIGKGVLPEKLPA